MSNFLYSVEREFAHPVTRLWSAWTTAAQLEQWYHPTILLSVPGLTVSDARVDGQWKTAVDVPMNDFVAYFWGRYAVVNVNERIEHSLSYSQDKSEFEAADPDAPAHRIVVEFDDRGGKTWVKFSQFGELPAEQIDATRDGMESYFDSLEMFLEE